MTEQEKRAFWGALGKGLWQGAKGLAGAGLSGVKGAVGFGASSMGNKAVNRAVNTITPLAMTGASLVSAGGGLFGGQGGQPGVNNPFTGNRIVTASLAPLSKEAFAEHMAPSDMVDAASYAAFLGSQFVDPHAHPELHAALDAAGLLGLAGTTAYGMAKSRDEYRPGMKDLVGLGLMGSALYDRVKSH